MPRPMRKYKSGIEKPKPNYRGIYTVMIHRVTYLAKCWYSDFSHDWNVSMQLYANNTQAENRASKLRSQGIKCHADTEGHPKYIIIDLEEEQP